MEHRKRSQMQHKVELTLALKALMAGSRTRKTSSHANNEGSIMNDAPTGTVRLINRRTKEAVVFA